MFGVGEAARRARAATALPRRPSAAAAFLAAVAAAWRWPRAAARCPVRGSETPAAVRMRARRRLHGRGALAGGSDVPAPIRSRRDHRRCGTGVGVRRVRGDRARGGDPAARGLRGARHVRGRRPMAAGSRFRVQVGSLSDQAAADDFAGRVRGLADAEAIVRWSPETRTYQVRAGDFATREEAVALSSRLQQLGVSGGGSPTSRASPRPGRLRLLETGDEFSAASVVPAQPEDTLSADGMTYRGVLEVRPGEAGLTVINVLNLEDYLKGVVPNELSPDVFPPDRGPQGAGGGRAHLRAAQPRPVRGPRLRHLRDADAARSTAGQSTEQPLSTQAVDETCGTRWRRYQRRAHQRALHVDLRRAHRDRLEHLRGRGARPTCVGVSCAPEREAWATIHTTAAPRALGDQPDLNRDAALLVSLDVLRREDVRLGRAHAGAPPRTSCESWVARLVVALQAQAAARAPAEGPLTRRGSLPPPPRRRPCAGTNARQRLLSPGRRRLPAAASRTGPS